MGFYGLHFELTHYIVAIFLSLSHSTFYAISARLASTKTKPNKSIDIEALCANNKTEVE